MIKIKHFALRPKLADHELPQNEKIDTKQEDRAMKRFVE